MTATARSRRMRVLTALVASLAVSQPLFADDYIVDFDQAIDFAAIKTFTLRDGVSTSARSELADPLILKNLKQTVARLLTARGLEDAGAEPADVVVEFRIESQEYVIGSGGRANPVSGPGPGGPGGRGGRGGRGVNPVGRGSVDFSDVGLVIDIVAAQPSQQLLIWRGVSRDRERDVAKLVEKLPSNARKLLADYPPKRRRR